MAQPLPAPVDEPLTKPRPLVFPTESTVPETKEHLDLRTALYLVLCEAFGQGAWVGSDQFVYYDASDPARVVAPDVFVRRGGPDESFASWKVWERGCPELAIEIVSESDASSAAWEKKLARYHAVGVAELVRFHADAERPLRVWDRVDDDLVERRVDGRRTTSRVLGCDFVVVQRALRLERDGVTLPTPSERAAAEAKRATAEAKRATAEAKRAAAEAKRADGESRRADAERQAGEARALEAARVAIADLAEAYGVALDEHHRGWIAEASLDALAVVRAALKRDRAWPTTFA